MRRIRSFLLAPIALLALGAAKEAKTPKGMDPVNPTCPAAPNWSLNPKMVFTPQQTSVGKVIVGEGIIDAGIANRLADVLRKNPDAEELWLRSPGGDAVAGNEAGRVLRKFDRDITTRIPKGWACFSACNFVFMGGRIRIVEPGGLFIVHMFTHVSDREGVKQELRGNADQAVDMISDIEQDSALLATDDNDFLIRMGVSRKLLSEVMYQQKSVASSGKDKSTRRCLTQNEVYNYNVANAR